MASARPSAALIMVKCRSMADRRPSTSSQSNWATWNTAFASRAAAAAAVRAALKVQERLAAEAGKEGAFRIRIGLNTGSCIVGNVGSVNRINYTAIGDSVNVAARLEAANKELGTAILASQSTVAAAGAGFVCRHLGPIHVKGRAEEVDVHEVVGLQA